LVERQVDALHLAGWRYGSVTALVEGFETGLLWVGLLLALVFADFAHVYGVIAVALFLLMRMNAAFFDFKAARAALTDELYIYIEREVGRFYASDAGGAVLRLKTELATATTRQTETLSAAMGILTATLQKNNEALTQTLAEGTATVGQRLAASMDTKLIDMNDALQATVEQWQQALAQSATAQAAMNDTADRTAQASLRLQTAGELLAKHLQGHSGAMSEQLIALVTAVQAVQQAITQLGTQQEALAAQAVYIERNQHGLETSLAAYESALQGLTQSLGDSLGAFIRLHGQSSAQIVADALKNNVEKFAPAAPTGGTTALARLSPAPERAP